MKKKNNASFNTIKKKAKLKQSNNKMGEKRYVSMKQAAWTVFLEVIVDKENLLVQYIAE